LRLIQSKGKDHIPSTSQKAGLTGLYKKFFFVSATAISKPVLQEVDGTVILPLTFIKEWAFPAYSLDHLGQACQTGGPIASSMWPAMTFSDLHMFEN